MCDSLFESVNLELLGPLVSLCILVLGVELLIFVPTLHQLRVKFLGLFASVLLNARLLFNQAVDGKLGNGCLG